MQTHKFFKNSSGVILITVVLLTIVLTIVTIGIMSLNVSQVKSSKSVVDAVVEEQLATGLFYQDYQRKFEGIANPTGPSTITVGGQTYAVTRNEAANAGPNNTNQIQFNLLLQ